MTKFYFPSTLNSITNPYLNLYLVNKNVAALQKLNLKVLSYRSKLSKLEAFNFFAQFFHFKYI